MNSCYGKTIEKPVDKDIKYMNDDDFEKHWIKNYNKIIEGTLIEGRKKPLHGQSPGVRRTHTIKVIKQIENHFFFSLLGIQVLSMSKRIMNEVMCLAYDLGCHIYYQDTDSMHIEVDDLPLLVKAFNEKYNRELIGTHLGQFHSDFPTINGHDEIPKSIESYS